MYRSLEWLSCLVLLATALSCDRFADNRDPLGMPGADELLSAPGSGLLLDESAMTAAFASVRNELYGEDAGTSDPRLAEAPGRRVFLCAYGAEGFQACTTAAGSSLADSLRRAGRALKRGGSIDEMNPAELRLKLDVVERVDEGVLEKTDPYESRVIGRFGYWVDLGEQISWVLPSEILEKRIYSNSRRTPGIVPERLWRRLEARNPELGPEPDRIEHTRIWTVSWVEKETRGERPEIFRAYRLHDSRFDEVDEATLLQRAIWATDYLISSVAANGRIRYHYFVSEDRERPSNALIRHCGTTYAMLQAYERTRFLPYLEAGQAALEYVLEQSEWKERHGHYGGGRVYFYVWEGSRHVHLGGMGLALLMINQYAQATGDYERYLEEARGYARFIVSQQKESGEFVYRASPVQGGRPSHRTSAFYPGEAILGLARLYAYDPDPIWLETAIRGADWLIDVRDAEKTERNISPDHWLLIGLSHLYDVTRDERYLVHTRKITRRVQRIMARNQAHADDYPDFAGSHYDPPSTTGAATNAEGLTAALDTCALAGVSCSEIESMLYATARHLMLSQYTPERMWWPPNRARAFGGWSGGLLDPSVRNDFVQHNLSGILGAERHMAARNGRELPGGPEWTRRLRETLDFPGIESTRMNQLRAETLHYRGKTRWESD